MPYWEPDPSDPYNLVGVEVPAHQSVHLEMAYAFAEEFARLGFDEGRLLRLFKNPFYRSAHRAFRILGEEKTESIVREALQIWGRTRVVERQAGPTLVQLEGRRRDQGKKR